MADHSIIKRSVPYFALFIIPVVIFALVQLTPYSAEIITTINRGSDNIFLIVVPLLSFVLIFTQTGWKKHFFASSFIALIFGLFLKWFWTYGYTNTTHLLGYLPSSDAGFYYQKAIAFLMGIPIEGTAANRPLFTLFLSSVLWVSNLNPMLAFWILAYLNVFGVLLAANSVYQTHGAWAASILITCEVLFFRYFIGTFMTEQLGLLVGNLAFSALWVGFNNKKLKLVYFGIALLSLSLNIRAGAMFVIFTVPVAVGFVFKKRRFSAKAALIALAFGMSGFLINSLVSNLFIDSGQKMFANFGYTLYGVAVGNKGWYQIILDHPGITAAEVLPTAINQILANPKLFLTGVARTYIDFMNPGTCWAFCFLRFSSILHNIVVLVLAILGLLYLVRQWRQPLSILLFSVFIGILFSIPFAPMIDVGYRSFTVTNPYLITLLFVGLSWLKLVKIKKPSSQQLDIQYDIFSERINWINYALTGICLLGMVVFPSMVTYLIRVAPRQSSFTCQNQPNSIQLSIWTNRAAWIQIVPNDSFAKGMSIPYVTPARFDWVLSKAKYHLQRGYDSLSAYAYPGNAIGILTNDLNSANSSNGSEDLAAYTSLVVLNSKDLPAGTGVLHTCVHEVYGSAVNESNIRLFVADNLSVEEKVEEATQPNKDIMYTSSTILDGWIAYVLLSSLCSALFFTGEDHHKESKKLFR